MKLELNLPALERLIGGDTEIEIGIRQQIVEQFCKHHIKTLMHSELWSKFYGAWRDELLAEIKKLEARFKEDLSGRGVEPGYEPHYELKKLVENTAGPMLQKFIQEEITKSENYLWSKIMKSLEKLLANEAVQLVRQQIDTLIKTAVGGEMDKLVEAEIHRRLKWAQEAVRAV